MSQYKPVRDFAVATDITGKYSSIKAGGVM